MQAVILAGGKGERMLPLTATRPKPLIPLLNKAIIEHTISSLQGSVDELVIVVGYLGDKIKNYLGNKYLGMNIHYVEQTQLNGTGGALLCAEKHLQDRFCLISADDLYSGKDIAECLKYESAVLAKKVQNPERFGVLETENDLVKNIEEKPKNPVSCIVSTMFFIFNKRIIEEAKKITPNKKGEIDLSDAVKEYVQKEKMNCVIAKDYWHPLAYPWDLLSGMNLLFSKIDGMRPEIYHPLIDGGTHVEPGPKIILGKNTRIKSGTVIEGNLFAGENCVIGPHAYLRGNVCLGNNCHVGRAEIKNSILFDYVKAHHTCEILDSIIGQNCNIAAQTVTANKRVDDRNVKSEYEGTLVDTGLRKFGTVMGDESQTTCGTVINPGRKYWPNTFNKEKNIREDVK